MLNILDVFQKVIDFIVYLFTEGANAINSFFDMFGKISGQFASLGDSLPSFAQPLWIFVFSFCCLALIIKLVPFIG